MTGFNGLGSADNEKRGGSIYGAFVAMKRFLEVDLTSQLAALLGSNPLPKSQRIRASEVTIFGEEAEPPPVAGFDMDQRALAALDDVLEMGEAERATWFGEFGAADPALANQVALLLKIDETGRQVMPTSVAQSPQFRGPDLPTRIGPYRLVRQLGQGGMGDVFLGERDDGLFEQTVAIKIIKPGVLSPQLADRFAEERRILAKLQHPHIAQLFDGGVTDQGLSYIIMEHLQGESIIDHVESSSMDLYSILKLFLDVNSAVQFAHENLVVHADIKPSNIIVTQKSGVKLLDFGIAQFLDRVENIAGGDGSPQPMTFAYAAPERLLGASPSVSSDIYALGAVLHEMLVGSLPDYVPQGQDGPRRAWPKASEDLKRAGSRAHNRPSRLRGDLDAIIAKALAPQISQRYASVVQLADDIDRHLKRLPVKARDDTWQYRSQKFVSRHKAGLFLTAAVGAGLGLAVATTTFLYIESEHARARAVQHFRETRSMANYMMFDVDPELAQLPGSLPLRKSIVSKGHAYLKALQADPDAPRDVKTEVANGYLRLARIYGLDPSGGLGDLKSAYSSLQQANDIINSIPTTKHDAAALQLARADTMLVKANAAFLAASPETMRTTLLDLNIALKRYDALLAEHPDSTDAWLGRTRAKIMCGRILLYLDRPQESIAVARQAEETPAPKSMSGAQLREWNYLQVARDLISAEAFEEAGNLLEMKAHYSDLVSRVEYQRRIGVSGLEFDFIEATAFVGLAKAASANGRFDEALSLNLKAIATLRRILSFGPNDGISLALTQEQMQLAAIYTKKSDYRSASRWAQAAVASIENDLEKAPGNHGEQRVLALYLSQYGSIQRESGDTAKSCATDQRDWEIWQAVDRSSGTLAMDLDANGPLRRLQTRMSACGRPIALEALRPIPSH